MPYPTTPDGRYFVVNGRLWRCTNPALPAEERAQLTRSLMQARRDVGAAQRRGDETAEQEARRQVHAAKAALGERGPVWWTDGAPDYNRRSVLRTPYADWYRRLSDADLTG